MRIAYFSNQYPSVTHTFIRREIRALESLGLQISRYALRSGENLIDTEDKVELERTRYVLKAGIAELARCCFAMLLSKPAMFLAAIQDAIIMGWRSDRGILRHFAYVVEAVTLARWCISENIQHIHAHFGTNSAAIAMLASRVSGIPFSFTAHGPDEFERATLLSLGLKLERATFAVCVSSFGRSQLMRWTEPAQWGKIAIVHCGVDRIFFDSPLQFPPLAPRLICVGRLSEQKAQIVLVSAARKLHDAGVDFEIILAGDGPMRCQIEEAIRCGGLQNKITIMGWASGEQVRAEIAAARALVLPSFSENMPVVIMEALALGRPVIATYVAGIPELADAMREVFAAPLEKLAAMGAGGRLHIIEQHDNIKEAVKLKSLFEKHLSNNRNCSKI
jgi:glycosyltransferase involved in cell wall biosynthesis